MTALAIVGGILAFLVLLLFLPLHLLFRYEEGFFLTVKYAFFRYKSVKFFRIFIYCAVAVFAHVVYYFRHRLRDGLICFAAAGTKLF